MSSRRFARIAGVVVLAAAAVALSGCTTEGGGVVENFGFPHVVSTQGETVEALWKGAWISALATGVVVWGLIIYAAVKFRRRSASDVPVQVKYHLPLEIFYTIVPVLMVIVLFFHTVKAQNDIAGDDLPVDLTVEVTGQQWSWTFNYGLGDQDLAADEDRTDDVFPYTEYAYEVGTASHIPVLYLPVGKTVEFNLHSPDVIHDFGVPQFGIKQDVVPGRINHYKVTPTEEGTYKGACYELCGVYHSRMLFQVKVVSEAEYETYLQGLQDKGFVAEKPLLGNADTTTQAGLETEEN